MQKDAFSKPFLKLQYDRTSKSCPQESEGNIALLNFYYCVPKVSSSKLITEKRNQPHGLKSPHPNFEAHTYKYDFIQYASIQSECMRQ